MSTFKYEIAQSIASLSTEKNGKEINMVSWNDRPPKYDNRSWPADHSKIGKDVTLSAEELSVLKTVLAELI